jgi:hypothetical protein
VHASFIAETEVLNEHDACRAWQSGDGGTNCSVSCHHVHPDGHSGAPLSSLSSLSSLLTVVECQLALEQERCAGAGMQSMRGLALWGLWHARSLCNQAVQDRLRKVWNVPGVAACSELRKHLCSVPGHNYFTATLVVQYLCIA